MEEGDRSFTVLELLKPGQKNKKGTMKKTSLTAGVGGRFISKDPMGAAKKAFTQACREKKIKGQCTLVIKVQETTAGSSKKVFVYKAKRIKRKEPLILTRGGVDIKIQYDVEIKSSN